MSINVLVTLSCLLAVVNCQTNYCSIQNCSPNTHIACNNNFKFSSSCVSPKILTLNSGQMQRVVDLHNKYRNDVAMGKLGHLPGAKRMAQVTWSNELGWSAGLNTLQCKMQHDKCHSSPNYKFSGQNLGMMMTSGSYTVEEVIDDTIRRWFNENKDANRASIDKVGASTGGKTVGHFTAMVTDRTTRVGCAISSFRDGNWNTYLMACNYASTNMMGSPVYKSGSPASACQKGGDAKYPGLCKTSEPIDPNAF